MDNLDKIIGEIDRVYDDGKFYKAMDCFTVLKDLKKFILKLQKGGHMEKTIKIDFQVGDKVTATFGEIKGQVSLIGILKDDIAKYYVDVISSDGDVNGRWFEAFQLAKVE